MKSIQEGCPQRRFFTGDSLLENLYWRFFTEDTSSVHCVRSWALLLFPLVLRTTSSLVSCSSFVLSRSCFVLFIHFAHHQNDRALIWGPNYHAQRAIFVLGKHSGGFSPTVRTWVWPPSLNLWVWGFESESLEFEAPSLNLRLWTSDSNLLDYGPRLWSSPSTWHGLCSTSDHIHFLVKKLFWIKNRLSVRALRWVPGAM